MTERKLITLENPDSSIGEIYRKIRTSIEYAGVDKPIKNVNITSIHAGETKTTTSCNLAVIFANQFAKVLLIDTDLRKPSVHRFMNIKNTKGLTDLILDYSLNKNQIQSVKMENYLTKIIHANMANELTVITAGSKITNPSELLGSAAFKNLVHDLSLEYDMIIIDSAPCGVVVDGIISSAAADATVMVFEYNKSSLEYAKKTIQQMKKDGANIIGGILVKTPVSNLFSRYYSPYNYYYSEKESDQNE